MHKVSATLVLGFTVFASAANAQKIVYACQFVESAGLYWKNGHWTASNFQKGLPFFLNREGNTLTKLSLSKVMETDPTKIVCTELSDSWDISCTSRYAETIAFSFKTLEGGMSRLFGSMGIISTDRKDNIGVSPFTCTQM